MAEILDSMPPVSKGGTQATYPWNDWLDGRVWRITRGIDYTIPTSSMRTSIRNKAVTRGRKVTISRSGDSLIFRVLDVSDKA